MAAQQELIVAYRNESSGATLCPVCVEDDTDAGEHTPLTREQLPWFPYIDIDGRTVADPPRCNGCDGSLVD